MGETRLSTSFTFKVLQHFRQIAGAMKDPQDPRRNCIGAIYNDVGKATQWQKPYVLRSKVSPLFSKIGMGADQLGCLAHRNAQILSGAEVFLADPGNCLSKIRQGLWR